MGRQRQCLPSRHRSELFAFQKQIQVNYYYYYFVYKTLPSIYFWVAFEVMIVFYLLWWIKQIIVHFINIILCHMYIFTHFYVHMLPNFLNVKNTGKNIYISPQMPINNTLHYNLLVKRTKSTCSYQ